VRLRRGLALQACRADRKPSYFKHSARRSVRLWEQRTYVHHSRSCTIYRPTSSSRLRLSSNQQTRYSFSFLRSFVFVSSNVNNTAVMCLTPAVHDRSVAVFCRQIDVVVHIRRVSDHLTFHAPHRHIVNDLSLIQSLVTTATRGGIY